MLVGHSMLGATALWLMAMAVYRKPVADIQLHKTSQPPIGPILLQAIIASVVAPIREMLVARRRGHI